MSELITPATPLKLASHINYNPDVLTCLANLSNDEVFTPPELANQMLDMLPADLWTNKNTKFLDPVTKTGVFLREIVKRLATGLAQEIPDLQTRINHICTQQVHGIAITELTSLLARRSVYCAKTANSDLSICSAFGDVQGNIRFERTQHTWKDGKCTHCGASEAVYSRDEALETHAYSFIHMSEAEIERAKSMKFDVIIGNPPYQLSDGGNGASAFSIYPKFVEQAIKLNPRFLSMIIPSRWFAGGGRGLPEFREMMLNDDRIRVIHDYLNASECFPGVEIKGGVNYFYWDRDNRGPCVVHTHSGKDSISIAERRLRESGTDTFIRYNDAISILKKIQAFKEGAFSNLVSANDPFGFDVRQENSLKRVKPKFELTKFIGSIPFYYNGWKREGLGYIEKVNVRKHSEWLNKFKIFVPKAIGSGDVSTDCIKPIVPLKNACCSETYIVIGPFETEEAVNNVISYIDTKFFHLLVSLKKNTQEARRSVYEFIPVQDFNESWTDEKLYAKYGLTVDEIAFIESMIRPMDVQTVEG